MAEEDVVSILDEAARLARARGLDCEGWCMQSNEDGYVAWLYREDDDGQWSLFDEVENLPTALESARWVLAQIQEG